MAEVFIFDAVRTPRGRGKATGSLHEVRAVDLLAGLFKALACRNQHFDPSQVEDVLLGCVTPIAEQGGNIARTAVLHAGWGIHPPGLTLNRFCGSGLEAINLAGAKLASGWVDLVVAGGIESMSRNPMGSDGGALFSDPSVSGELLYVPQGIGADLIATLEGFSRDDVDQFAARSHTRASLAWSEARFQHSVEPVYDQNGLLLLDRDETVRAECDAASLASLKPAFQKLGALGFDQTARARYPHVATIDHVHHAGNSSGIVDGAALVLLGSAAAATQHQLRPRARILATAEVGSEPTIMLTGPTPAMEKVLRKAGLSAADIDLFEINEAFAAVVLKAIKDLKLDPERVNVNGGAIAMGHPLGATGAMLLGTALDELERRGGRYALVTLCVGGGMGVATVIERLEGGR